MTAQQTEVLIIGAGQAGIATSEHLSRHGIEHLILERDRVAERWRTWRWDSLVANGPAWHDRFPSQEFRVPPDSFATKDQIVEYLTEYARRIDAPIRTGVEVTRVRRNDGRPGFRVETSDGPIEARYVVAATGAFQTPIIPRVIPEDSGIAQLHSSAYRNPEQLDDGAVLVIGAGSSGAQIAEELRAAGRAVHLAVGPHARPPRSYRGRDFCWWLGVLGKWEQAVPAAGAEHVTIAVSGAHGGHTIDFRALAATGITLLGRAQSYRDGVLSIADDLRRNIAAGDADHLSILDEADEYIERHGLDLPEEPSARATLPDPPCLTDPVREVNLAAAGITSVVWAVGYGADYGWLEVDAVDERGRPRHQRGVSTEPGVYFIGLPWQSRRGSSFIWGVWHDASYIADHIAVQRGYLDYHAATSPVATSAAL